MVLVVTSCSSRKALRPFPLLRAETLPFGRLAEVGLEWKARVSNAEPHLPASALYRGRGFSLAAAAAKEAGGTLRVVSAGLGLIDGDCPIPAYGLTVSSGYADSVLSRITGPVTAADWWHAVRERDARKIDEGRTDLVLVAMSSVYLRMITDELANTDSFREGRLRIFTGAAVDDVDPRLRNFVLGYDERLDGPKSPLPGTKADFAQRALHNFVSKILSTSPSGSVKEHKQRVEDAQVHWTLPIRRVAQRKPDVEIKALISRHWVQIGGNAVRMHQFLRNDLAVACEQRRFRALFEQVRDERAA